MEDQTIQFIQIIVGIATAGGVAGFRLVVTRAVTEAVTAALGEVKADIEELREDLAELREEVDALRPPPNGAPQLEVLSA